MQWMRFLHNNDAQLRVASRASFICYPPVRLVGWQRPLKNNPMQTDREAPFDYGSISPRWLSSEARGGAVLYVDMDGCVCIFIGE
jgi:hypothetical protein